MSARAEAIRTAKPSAPLYAYWHLLSLDAPTVAVVWCCAFTASAGVRLAVYVPLALAVATWMLYVADRLLDVRHPRSTEALVERHWFHDSHATSFLSCFAVAAALLLFVAAREIPHILLGYELAVAVVVAFYFVAIHVSPSRFAILRRSPCKEIIVGAIFSIAVALPSWTYVSSMHLLSTIVGFAALCALNCLVIAALESPLRANSALPAFCERALLVLSSAALAAVFFSSGQRILFVSISLSALLLVLLCRSRSRLSSLSFRIAVDAAMLTPVLFAPWHWMHR